MLKHISTILLLLLLHTITHAQVDRLDRFRVNLENAHTLEDTLLSVITLKTTNTEKPEENIAAIDRYLTTRYPHWVYVETVILNTEEEDVDLSQTKIESLSNVKLEDYIRTLQMLNRDKTERQDLLEEGLPWQYQSTSEQKAIKAYLTAEGWIRAEDRDSVIYYLQQVHELLAPDRFPMLQLYAINESIDGQPDVVDIIRKGISISESIPEYHYRATFYSKLQNHLKRKGKLKEAMQAGQMLLEINEAKEDTTGLVIALINQAAFLQEQGQFDKAYALIAKGRELAQEKKDSFALSATYASEANAKMNETKYEEAIKLLKYSIRSSPSSNSNLPLFYINLIDCYYTTEQIDSAYHCYTILMKVDPMDKSGLLTYTRSFIVPYLIKTGQLKLAQNYIDDALIDAKEYGDISHESMVYLSQSQLYETTGQYQQALEYYKQHTVIEMDFRNEEKAAEITKANLDFEFSKEKELISLRNEAEKLKIRSQRNKALFIGGLGVLLALFGLAVYVLMRNRNKVISTQNTQLSELNAVKDTLFQIIGHDLKNPTIGFRNISKKINYLLEKRDYDRLKLLGEEIDQDAKSLYNLTDNLLNWALIQKDAIVQKPEKVHLRNIVEETIKLFQNIADRKGVAIENHVKPDDFAHVDYNAMSTIIRNLIDNAIKYTYEGGKITLESKKLDGIIRISIKDTGIGMKKEQIENIQNNTPLSSTRGTHDEKGSGVGLQLVRQLVDKNKGIFEIVSAIDQGTIFTVGFPMTS